MRIGRSVCFSRILPLLLICFATVTIVRAQGANQTAPRSPNPAAGADQIKERDKWFLRGRLVHSKNSAELRRQAYLSKLRMRAQRAASPAKTIPVHGMPLSSGPWVPL